MVFPAPAAPNPARQRHPASGSPASRRRRSPWLSASLPPPRTRSRQGSQPLQWQGPWPENLPRRSWRVSDKEAKTTTCRNRAATTGACVGGWGREAQDSRLRPAELHMSSLPTQDKDTIRALSLALLDWVSDAPFPSSTSLSPPPEPLKLPTILAEFAGSRTCAPTNSEILAQAATAAATRDRKKRVRRRVLPLVGNFAPVCRWTEGGGWKDWRIDGPAHHSQR